MFYSLKAAVITSACLSMRKVLIRHARPFFIFGMIVSLLPVGLLNKAQASDGFVLDSSFSRDGKQTTNLGTPSKANAIALQSDGKIIVAGQSFSGINFLDFTLARYNTDGSLDTTFGDRGRVTTNIREDASDDTAYAIALQPDGKIVAAGTSLTSSQRDFALARYNPDGQLDTTFGTDGKVVTDFGNSSVAYAVALQSNGKIVAAGVAGEGSNSDFALARYNPNGQLDPTFDADGKVTTNFFNETDTARGIVFQPGGRIVLAGAAAKSGPGDYDIALARYTSNGSLDQAFGNGGKVTTDFFGDDDAASAITLQTDGKMVVAGLARPSNIESDFALVRYNRNGSLDHMFGNGGKVATQFMGSIAVAFAIDLEPVDGKIVAAGSSTHPHQGFQIDYAVARYNHDGSPDDSFAPGGQMTTDFFCDDDIAMGVAVQPDNKVVAAGFSTTESGPIISLARYPAQRPASPDPKLLSVSLSRSTTPGCHSVAGAVTLGAPAPSGGLQVSLTDNLAAASVPASVFVPAGETTACFSVSTTPVTHTQVGNIVARLGGVTQSATLIVQPITAFPELHPNPVTGPNDVTGTVRLDCPAPAGGLTVQLSSRNPGVAHPLPTSIFIPEGSDTADFGIQTADVPSPRSAVITATVNGISRSNILRVE